MVTWPAATSVSLLDDKGRKGERPWERGLLVYNSRGAFCLRTRIAGDLLMKLSVETRLLWRKKNGGPRRKEFVSCPKLLFSITENVKRSEIGCVVFLYFFVYVEKSQLCKFCNTITYADEFKPCFGADVRPAELFKNTDSKDILSCNIFHVLFSAYIIVYRHFLTLSKFRKPNSKSE